MKSLTFALILLFLFCKIGGFKYAIDQDVKACYPSENVTDLCI